MTNHEGDAALVDLQEPLDIDLSSSTMLTDRFEAIYGMDDDVYEFCLSLETRLNEANLQLTKQGNGKLQRQVNKMEAALFGIFNSPEKSVEDLRLIASRALEQPIVRKYGQHWRKFK